jgi:hypothetical protein
MGIPLLVMGLRRLTPKQLRLLGLAVTSAGVVGLLVFVGRDLARWLTAAPPDFRRYAFQRMLFTIGTTPDVPLVQVIAAGVVCWLAGLLRKKRSASAPKRQRNGIE